MYHITSQFQGEIQLYHYLTFIDYHINIVS